MESSEVYVGNISKRAVVLELVEFLERRCGHGTVLSCVIETAHGNWMSKGFGFVQFASKAAAKEISDLAQKKALVFYNKHLKVDVQKNVSHGGIRGSSRVEGAALSMGYMREENVMEYVWSCSNIAVEFCFGRCQLNLLLEENGTEYKLESQFSDLHFAERCSVSNHKSLLLQLCRPPLIFKGYPTDQLTPVFDNAFTILHHYKALRCNNYNYTYSKWPKEPHWVRTTDFTSGKAIGLSLVYCLEFFTIPESAYKAIVDSLSDYHRAPFPQKISLVKAEPYASQQELVPILSSTESYKLPSEVVYRLNHLVQSGYLSPPAVSHELLSLLQKLPAQQSVLALEKFVTSSAKTCLEPLPKIQEYLQQDCQLGMKLDEGQTFVKRLLVTPSKVYCMKPEVEGTNRVTRRYSTLIDNFLRVSFVDEDFGTLHSNATSVPKKIAFQSGLLPEPSDVYHRILSVLQDGVHLGGKHFRFLAFSPSQLREHSLWMFANSEDVTADSIRSWMGEFENFNNVAKCAARMGQSFSSSKPTLEVHSTELDLIDDIEKDGGIKYCFSDGIGKISKSFATNVAKVCGAKVVPSAFQIRYGGYKGVVAVDPTSCSKLSLRPSMLKFPSEQIGVDVLKWTQYAPYYLNRQVIILMSTLGVKDEVFEKMQEQELHQLNEMLKDPEMAVEVLQTSCTGDSYMIMVEMILAGYMPTEEPYLRSLVNSFRALQLNLLRIKSRIYVPKGRCLMGCLDETATLDYGQVFVQVSPTPGTRNFVDDGLDQPHPRRGISRRERACVVRGQVVVAKNPCLHPGDLLVLEAVDIPELHHMVDCVVFPRQGKRPHPNECSGSDLDGDLYFVTWDKLLIPPSKYEPMSYEPVSAAQLDHSVTLQEIKEFFVDNMLSDSLGVISNAHLVHADKEEERAKHPSCLELARLASTAVDFAKTGVPAVIPIDLRPKDYPDFMENEFKSTYKSQSVLGKLYRSVTKNSDPSPGHLVSKEDIQREYDCSLRVEDYERHLPEAVSCKSSYDRKLTSLLKHYEVTEAEIITRNILRFTKANQKQRGDVRDRISFAVTSLRNEARSWFEAGGLGEQEQLAKAYAWYHVTYHPDYRNPRKDAEQPPELLSFPWVVSDKLLVLRAQRTG